MSAPPPGGPTSAPSPEAPISTPSPGAVWQRPDVAHPFLDQRQTLVPLVDVQEDLIRRLLARHPRPLARVLDVGSGNGAMAELALALGGAGSGSTAVLVDFSQPMLERAGARLERFAGRWQTLHGDLSSAAWSQPLPAGGFGAAVSALAIHHLPAERKRALFGELFALLAPGGIFVNMDYVAIGGPLRGLFDEQLIANAVRAEHECGGTRSDEEVERDWADDSDEDRPDSVEDQLRWLTGAGFEEVELHFKWAEAAVFSGVRPAAA